MNMTEGFSAIGGPWITPEMSMQHMVWSETEVSGPGKVSIELERPDDGPIEAKTLKLKDVGYYKDYRGGGPTGREGSNSQSRSQKRPAGASRK